MAGPRSEEDRVREVVTDLLRVQVQLMSPSGPQNRGMQERAKANALRFLEELQLGEIRITRWRPPTDDEIEALVGRLDEL